MSRRRKTSWRATIYQKFSRGGKLDAIEQYHVGLDGGDADGGWDSRGDQFARLGRPAPPHRGVHAGVHHNVTLMEAGQAKGAAEPEAGGEEDSEG